MIFTLILNKRKKKINLKKDLCNQINNSKNSLNLIKFDIANKEVENIVTKWKALGRVNKNDNKVLETIKRKFK